MPYATGGAIDARAGLRHRSGIPVSRRHAVPHILIVEDEAATTDTLFYVLQAEGFATTWVTLTGEVLALRERRPAGLLILDVDLSDISGFEARKYLRWFSKVPVAFLTTRDAEIDRVVGLETGADGYAVKPFSPHEAAVRAKAIPRHMAPRPAALEGATLSGSFRVDEECARIRCRNTPLNLIRHKFHLLQVSLRQPKWVFSRKQLLDVPDVAGETGYERNIDNHIKSLRTRLRQVNEHGGMVQVRRGLGYSYSSDRA